MPDPSVSLPSDSFTVGDLIVAFLEACGVSTLYGVISIHNMPILDAVKRRGQLRFVTARGEAGAANMADASARVSGGLGVVVTSTGTACGNAAGALVEAQTAGARVLHLTGQIEVDYLDRNMGYIHEAKDQLGLLRSVSKAAYRVTDPAQVLPVLQEAVQQLDSAPSGPVSIEIPIDVQSAQVPVPEHLSRLAPTPVPTDPARLEALVEALAQARRPLIWVGGGAREAGAALEQLKGLGFGVVNTTQGRGIVDENDPQNLGTFTASPAVEALYQTCDAVLVVGSRLRGNETLKYRLKLPQPLYRVDADPDADGRCYPNELFVQGDATEVLTALAERLVGRMSVDPGFANDLQAAKQQAEARLLEDLGVYASLVQQVTEARDPASPWVRDITISNSMWGNRLPRLTTPRQGVHATGGGIGQGLAMGIGAALASPDRKTWVLVGDGGLQLGLAELATAVEEQANLVLLVMNSRGYEVIRNIQDAAYGGRHCYTDLLLPELEQVCASLKLPYQRIDDLQQTSSAFQWSTSLPGPVLLEFNMPTIGPFARPFAGPPVRKASA